MNDLLIPPFDFQRVIVQPWTTDLSLYGWLMVMGVFVAVACGLIGNYLILRRMALVGDAISHSVLPGIAVAFLLSHTRNTWVMFAGAAVAAVLTTVLIEAIHRHSRVKPDAATGITFTTLFAIGVVLIALFADKVDLDQDCVLNGELPLIPLLPSVMLGSLKLGPAPVVQAGIVALLTAGLIKLFYKELLVTSFDPLMASTLGIKSNRVHFGLMIWLAIVVVSAFEAVGAILVIAMLILPGATASLLSSRLPRVLLLSVAHAVVSVVLGLHLSIWLNCAPAAAMVVAGCGLFALAWAAYTIRVTLARRANLMTGNLAEPQPGVESPR